MLFPEKSQMEICLLKDNLEEIANELIAQRAECTEFDEEMKQKDRNTLKELKLSKSLTVETEKRVQENVNLAARRMHLNLQCEELFKAIEKARDEYIERKNKANDNKKVMELRIRMHEDQSHERATKLRETSACFDEAQMRDENEKIKESIVKLEHESAEKRAAVDARKMELDNLTPSVLKDLTLIIGKQELLAKAKSLSQKCDALEKRGTN